MANSTSTLPETVIEHLDGSVPRYSQIVRHYLRSHSTSVVAANELVAFIQDPVAENKRDMAIHLHHVSLPSLADAGLIDYDPRPNTARYRGGS